ncbi:MAG TPA: hypothetical protein VL334_02375, partial [Anaerolineae bacterium]|nr:hypothetical protein [Anaerolineae bacterium]
MDVPTLRSRSRRLGATAQAQADVLATPFSRLEQTLLLGFALTAIAPYAFNSVINMWELAIAAFVLLSPVLAKTVQRNLGILFLLSISVLIGQLSGTSGTAEKTATLAFLKVCFYVCFIAILGLRCRNADNRRFFLKTIVLPVAVLVCLSVWIDLFSGTRLFAEWQDMMYFRANPIESENYTLYDWLDLLDQRNRSSGLAQHPWHVIAWVMCGLLALMTLRTHRQFKSRWFWVFLALLFFTPLLLPQRNGLVGMVTAL